MFYEQPDGSLVAYVASEDDIILAQGTLSDLAKAPNAEIPLYFENGNQVGNMAGEQKAKLVPTAMSVVNSIIKILGNDADVVRLQVKLVPSEKMDPYPLDQHMPRVFSHLLKPRLSRNRLSLKN